jgi:hypothetical protein
VNSGVKGRSTWLDPRIKTGSSMHDCLFTYIGSFQVPWEVVEEFGAVGCYCRMYIFRFLRPLCGKKTEYKQEWRPETCLWAV